MRNLKDYFWYFKKSNELSSFHTISINNKTYYLTNFTYASNKINIALDH